MDLALLPPLSPRRRFLTPIAEAFTPETRARRVSILLTATALLCLGDLALTLIFITSVGMLESNPVARAVMAHDSPAAVVIWKLSTMVLGLGILFWARRMSKAEIAAWICFLTMVGLTFHWLGFANAMLLVTDPQYAELAMMDDPRWVSMTP
jgi:hypothetical protein